MFIYTNFGIFLVFGKPKSFFIKVIPILRLREKKFSWSFQYILKEKIWKCRVLRGLKKTDTMALNKP